MTLMKGVVVGLVKDVDDPLEEGRVRLMFPWLSEELSGWAPIASPMAGAKRGHYYLPEIDDEALVAFEQGDVDHPFVVGFLHNGVDVPPSDGIDKHVRRVRSVSGHVIDLDDRSGQERVQVKSHGGHSVEMKDADGTIDIRSNGGQHVTLKDSPAQIEVATSTGTTVTVTDSPSQVEIRTVGGVVLTISDTGVSVTAASAPVTVTCPTASIDAMASVTVNAPNISLNGASVSVNSAMAMFSGVVMCSSLIATSVVSSSYTPGVGNLL